ncbi:MAG: NADPH-dependent F420 reductase [Myxococcota bacterium]
MKIGIVGGAGKAGSGLGVRWARAGHAVTIGSRDEQRAAHRARELSRMADAPIAGAMNPAACDGADVVVLCVPYTVHSATVERLSEVLEDKTIIDLTVPLCPPAIREVHLPAGGAAALEARAILGDRARLVAALHHVSAAHLLDHHHTVHGDVLAASDDPDAMATALALIGDLGMRGLDAGPLRNAVALESLTPVLLHINKRYRAKGAGISITGLPGSLD